MDIDTLRLYDYPDVGRSEHVTAPKRSCLEAHGARLRLSRMLIDDIATIDGFIVRRVGTDGGRVKGYRIGEVKLTYEETLAVLEKRFELLPPKPLPDMFAVAKPPRQFASVIDYSEIVPTVQARLWAEVA